jgi:hypothetical protein
MANRSPLPEDSRAATDTRSKRGRVHTVVQLAHHNGLIHVGINKVDEHLYAYARGELGAPVEAGQGLRHTHPGAAGLVARQTAL